MADMEIDSTSAAESKVATTGDKKPRFEVKKVSSLKRSPVWLEYRADEFSGTPSLSGLGVSLAPLAQDVLG